MPSLVPSSIFHGDDVSLCGHRHLVWRTADICCAYFASCCTCSIRTLAVAECSCPFTVVTKWNDIHHYFFKVPWRASQGIPKRKLRQRSTCAASAATSCIQPWWSSALWISGITAGKLRIFASLWWSPALVSFVGDESLPSTAVSPVHKFQSWVRNESSTELYLAVLTAIQLYGFCQHHCPLSTINITGPYIGIGRIIYIIYLVILYLECQLLFNFLMKDARWADVAANSRSGCVVTRVMASGKKCDNVISLEIYTVNYRLLTSIYWLSIHKSYHLQKPPVRLCISAIPHHQSSIYLFYFLPLFK